MSTESTQRTSIFLVKIEYRHRHPMTEDGLMSFAKTLHKFIVAAKLIRCKVLPDIDITTFNDETGDVEADCNWTDETQY